MPLPPLPALELHTVDDLSPAAPAGFLRLERRRLALGDDGEPFVHDMVARRGPEEEWGTTSGKRRRILNLTDDSENPLGEWNTMVIECLGDTVRVWVNGDLVNDGRECTAVSGKIALQAEGTPVAFRRIALTRLQ